MLKNKSKFVKSVYDNKKLLAIFVKKSFLNILTKQLSLLVIKNFSKWDLLEKIMSLYKPIFILIAKEVINKTSEFLILKKGKAKIKFFKK